MSALWCVRLKEISLYHLFALRACDQYRYRLLDKTKLEQLKLELRIGAVESFSMGHFEDLYPGCSPAVIPQLTFFGAKSFVHFRDVSALEHVSFRQGLLHLKRRVFSRLNYLKQRILSRKKLHETEGISKIKII